jgi:hypothetical protein
VKAGEHTIAGTLNRVKPAPLLVLPKHERTDIRTRTIFKVKSFFTYKYQWSKLPLPVPSFFVVVQNVEIQIVSIKI